MNTNAGDRPVSEMSAAQLVERYFRVWREWTSIRVSRTKFDALFDELAEIEEALPKNSFAVARGRGRET